MKTIPAALATHLALDATTLATALRITRDDGTVYAFTSHDKDATISGVTYLANPGLDVTNIVIASGLTVGNLELRTLHDGTIFTASDILNGLWRNADFTIFRYNHQSVADGIDTLLTGTLGEVEIKNNSLVVELRDLRQYLQQPVGSPSSKTCRYRFGDPATCRVELDGSPGLTVTGTVTQVTSNQVFRDSSKTQADQYFTEGEFQWLTGANALAYSKVKTFERGSPPAAEFTLALPMRATVAIGDTYTVSPGCRKRLEDCIAHNNVLNFGGEPHRPGIDELTQSVTTDV